MKKMKNEIKNEISNIENYEDIIIKDDYINYLQSLIQQNDLTICESKIYQSKINKKEYLYPSVSSNQQIKTFFEKIKRNKKKYYYMYKFYLLLIHFFSDSYSKEILKQLQKNINLSDKQYIDFITKNMKKGERAGIYGNITNNSNNSNNKCPSKEFEFQHIFLDFKKIYKEIYHQPFTKKNMNQSNFTYLDIGCGNGNKTKLLANTFGIPLSHVYGTDIENWGPYSKTKKFNFHFRFIQKNNLLDFEENQFDFISCFFTLHHVDKLSLLLNEIKRILKPNGILLIIEHDAIHSLDSIIIDLQHTFYSYFVDKYKNPKNYKNYIQHPTTNRYLNKYEWNYLLQKHDLKYITSHSLYNNTPYETIYDNQYYAFYKNIKS
jgi:ubiquinone/menaquinone biosynthesis C-methylase UbiE